MNNGHVNGTMQVNPQQAAVYALQFIEQVAHTRAQREQFDMAVGMLQAIATGQVVLAPPPALPAPTAEELARPQ